jgi:hypothetical protein
MPLASSPPASKSPKQTPPSQLSLARAGVRGAHSAALHRRWLLGSRQRRRSLDLSFRRRLFGDETNSVSPKEEYSVSNGSNLIETRFVDGGRSQWTFLEAEGVEDQVNDHVAGQAYHLIMRACGSRGSGCTSLGQSGCGTHSLCVRSVLHRSSSSWSHLAVCLQRQSSALCVPACSRLRLRVPRRAEWRLDRARLRFARAS